MGERTTQQDCKPIWYSGYWRCKTKAMKEVVGDITNQLLGYEKFKKLRQRRRNEDAQRKFELQIESIVCELAHIHISGSSFAGMAIIRRQEFLNRRIKGKPEHYNSTIPNVLDLLRAPEMAFIEHKLGYNTEFGGMSTVLKPGKRLLTRLDEHDISLDDLTIDTLDREPIILRNGREDYWDTSKQVDYEDTELTCQYRQEMNEINEYLAHAHIEFDRDVLNECQLHETVDNRFLNRIFTYSSFESGGRLYGGFWQPLSKEQRKQGIRIQGEEVSILDYKSMNPTMLYALAGATNEDIESIGDLYSDDSVVRPGMKKIFNALLFTEKYLEQMPRGVRDYFPRSVTVNDVVEDILSKHSMIEDFFHRGIGHYLMFMESSIMVSILLKLKREHDVVALPIHDAVVVPSSMEDKAREIMKEVFMEHTCCSLVPAVTKE